VSRFSKRAAIIAVAITFSLVFAGSALAVTVFHPSVSVAATSQNHHITVYGFYDNASPKCKGPGGRVVLIKIRHLSTQTFTHTSGFYRVTVGPFAKGHYSVHVTVPGEVKGGYGKFVACLDARAHTSVFVHS
jgi:hypothetical protein